MQGLCKSHSNNIVSHGSSGSKAFSESFGTPDPTYSQALISFGVGVWQVQSTLTVAVSMVVTVAG